MGESPAAVDRPREVRIATLVFAVNAVLGHGVSTVATLVEPGFGSSDPAVTGPAFLWLGLVVSLGWLAVEVAAIVAVHRGRNWGRILLTALGALSILGSLAVVNAAPTATGGPLDTISTVTAVLTCVLFAAALVLVYRPDANAWFRTPRTGVPDRPAGRA